MVEVQTPKFDDEDQLFFYWIALLDHIDCSPEDPIKEGFIRIIPIVTIDANNELRVTLHLSKET